MDVVLSSNENKPGTVTFTVKAKYLWLILGLLLMIPAVAPVVASYLPSTQSTPGSGGGGGGGTTGSQVNCNNPCTITIKNSQFGTVQPIVVKVGTAVTWANQDNTQHTSTSNTGVWDSGVIGVGGSYSVTFNTTGSYPYHCNIHPMTGTIVVVS